MATGEAMWASSQAQTLSMKRQATTEDAGLMWTDEAVLVAALTRHNRSLIYEQSLLAVSAVPYSTDLFRRNIERSKEVNQAAHHMVVTLANFWDTRAQSALCRHCGVRLPDHRGRYCSADGCDSEKCADIRDQVWAAADQGKLLHIHDLLPATARTRDQTLNNMLALMSMYSAEAALTETVRMVHDTARASFTPYTPEEANEDPLWQKILTVFADALVALWTARGNVYRCRMCGGCLPIDGATFSAGCCSPQCSEQQDQKPAVWFHDGETRCLLSGSTSWLKPLTGSGVTPELASAHPQM